MSSLASPTTSQSNRTTVRLSFDNTYTCLPERFYSRVKPTPVAAPRLVKVNTELARSLGLDPEQLQSSEGVEVLAGNRIADRSEPIAQAYAGHQFGQFVPQLGDGRAILLGEIKALDGLRYDIQLKGAGPTRFSRRGDGRAALGPVLREYIVSEAMAAMGVPTTRALAAVTTGEVVFRETPLPGAVLTRVATSHLRVGTFEYFAAQHDTEATRLLAEYAIDRHYPEAKQAQHPYRALLDAVIARHAALVAKWMLIGFVHGVMNTDNTSISGETLDYGPCAFMEAYDPSTVFSSIDFQGRYAYANQPSIALWNLARFAETLLPHIELQSGSEESAIASATEALTAFNPQFQAAYLAGLRRKLGLMTADDRDAALAQDLLQRMTTNRADFTLTFRRLSYSALGPEHDENVAELFADPTAFHTWAVGWRQRLSAEPTPDQVRSSAMKADNPIFIPRNHLVEQAIVAAVARKDFGPFEELLEAISRPYEQRPVNEQYSTPARPEESVTQTFCGT